MKHSVLIWSAVIIGVAVMVLIGLYVIVPELGPVTPNGPTPGPVE